MVTSFNISANAPCCGCSSTFCSHSCRKDESGTAGDETERDKGEEEREAGMVEEVTRGVGSGGVGARLRVVSFGFGVMGRTTGTAGNAGASGLWTFASSAVARAAAVTDLEGWTFALVEDSPEEFRDRESTRVLAIVEVDAAGLLSELPGDEDGGTAK